MWPECEERCYEIVRTVSIVHVQTHLIPSYRMQNQTVFQRHRYAPKIDVTPNFKCQRQFVNTFSLPSYIIQVRI